MKTDTNLNNMRQLKITKNNNSFGTTRTSKMDEIPSFRPKNRPSYEGKSLKEMTKQEKDQRAKDQNIAQTEISGKPKKNKGIKVKGGVNLSFLNRIFGGGGSKSKTKSAKAIFKDKQSRQNKCTPNSRSKDCGPGGR
jgi:hypothetical protein